jgi:hypothetical protein
MYISSKEVRSGAPRPEECPKCKCLMYQVCPNCGYKPVFEIHGTKTGRYKPEEGSK